MNPVGVAWDSLAGIFDSITGKFKENADTVWESASALEGYYGGVEQLTAAGPPLSAALKEENDALAAAEEAERLAKEEAERLKATQDALKEAGILTTAQVEDQIKKYEALLPALENDDFATKQLTDKINELKTKLEEAKPATDNLTDSSLKLKGQFTPLDDKGKALADTWKVLKVDSENLNLVFDDSIEKATGFKNSQEALQYAESLLEDPRQKQIDQLEAIKFHYADTPEKAAMVEQAIKKLKEETKEGGYEFADYANFITGIIDKIPGIDQGLKDFTGTTGKCRRIRL